MTWLAVAICTIASAFFSGLETGFLQSAVCSGAHVAAGHEVACQNKSGEVGEAMVRGVGCPVPVAPPTWPSVVYW